MLKNKHTKTIASLCAAVAIAIGFGNFSTVYGALREEIASVQVNAKDVERDIYAHKVTNETRLKTCESHASVLGG
jgi:hypothetical protein